jgi:phage terminase large subunit
LLKSRPRSQELEANLLKLLEQEARELVSPKMEQWRKPSRIKLARGGRGAGAKSWSAVSLLVQELHYSTKRAACLREIQGSLSESVYQLIMDTVDRLGYKGWRFTNQYIENDKGSYIIFRGLKDMRAANQIKSLENFDIFFIEEAATVSMESLNLVLPTLRKTGSELWAVYNPVTETDPITVRLWNTDRQDMIKIQLEPAGKDNPWWTNELQKEMEAHFESDPEEALHVWHGLPRAQGLRAVMSREKIHEATKRLPDYTGKKALGVDVARFGDDKTVFCLRDGMAVKAIKSVAKMDTQDVALTAWDMVERDPTVSIKVDDSGVGGGVSDKLRKLGAKVVMVNFGARPQDKKLYTSCADEMWFTFPLDKATIPDDAELIEELSGRQYSYTNDERRKIEPKEQFKKRIGRSPDKADALILAYYEPKQAVISNAARSLGL